MEYKEFSEILEEKAKKININKIDTEKFYKYMELLLEWNTKINLTAIVDTKEIIEKHFIDSCIVNKYIKTGKLIDIGTGAGFPGIPLKIINNNIEITLLDSLNKRINFLNEAIKEIGLKNIKTIHGRAEEIGQDIKYREKYDNAIARAVAPINILLEYLLPFVKIGGICICMKGPNIEEIANIDRPLEILGGKIKEIKNITIPDTDYKRNIIIIEKIKQTPKRYPRKAGIPKKLPL